MSLPFQTAWKTEGASGLERSLPAAKAGTDDAGFSAGFQAGDEHGRPAAMRPALPADASPSVCRLPESRNRVRHNEFAPGTALPSHGRVLQENIKRRARSHSRLNPGCVLACGTRARV